MCCGEELSVSVSRSNGGEAPEGDGCGELCVEPAVTNEVGKILCSSVLLRLVYSESRAWNVLGGDEGLLAGRSESTIDQTTSFVRGVESISMCPNLSIASWAMSILP